MASFIKFGYGKDGELGLRFAKKVWEDLSKAVAGGNFTVDKEDGSVWIPLLNISNAPANAVTAAMESDSPPCPPLVEMNLP